VAVDQYQVELKLFRFVAAANVFFGFSLPVAAQPIDPSCADVAKAIDRLREQSWVLVSGTVTQGVHPEFYSSITSALLGGRQQIRILDGERFSSSVEGYDRSTLDNIIGASELHPDTPCESVKLSSTFSNSKHLEYTYSTKVTRADAHFRIWISHSSGLPVKVQIDGPQLLYRRSLSRPSKPPQVMLWPNGLHYDETREYIFGEVQVNQWLADNRIKKR
jgi:hypothetical protein